MEKLVILDYSTAMVHIYPVERDAPITDEYIENLGFHASDCLWMAGAIEFKSHNEILK